MSLEFMHQVQKRSQGCVGRKGVGRFDACVIRDFSPNQRRGLERALQRAGDDEVEVNLERAQIAADNETLQLALFIEWALDVNNRVCATGAGAGVPKNIEVHAVGAS